MIKGVLFDLDDTLYSQQQAYNSVFHDMLADKYDLDQDTFYVRYKQHADDIYRHYIDGEWTIEEVGIYRLQHALEDFGYSCSEEFALKFQKQYMINQQKIWLPDPIKEMLQYLRGKVKLGILSNGNSKRQWNKIRTLELLQWIKPENVIVSEDTGYSKPQPEIFTFAEKILGLNDGEILYVGDSFDHDIAPAHKKNWTTVWFNRRNYKVDDKDNCADFTVWTEEELLYEMKRIIQ